MFKRISIALFIGLLSISDTLAGDYDGVWVFDGQTLSDYYVATQNGGTLLLVGAYAEMDGWDAFIGNIGTGNRARMRTLLSPDDVYAEFTVIFASPTTGHVVIHSCTDCDAPLGRPLPISKIF